MKKSFVLLVMILTIAVSPTKNVQAYEHNVVAQMDKENANTPKADVIVRKYRINNGVTQYRRWNETRGCWVDPDWIDAN